MQHGWLEVDFPNHMAGTSGHGSVVRCQRGSMGCARASPQWCVSGGGGSFTTRPCTTSTSFFLFFPETNTQSKHQEGVAGTDGTSQRRWQVTGKSTCFIPAASLSTLRPDTLTAFFLAMGAQHMRRCIHPGFF